MRKRKIHQKYFLQVFRNLLNPPVECLQTNRPIRSCMLYVNQSKYSEYFDQYCQHVSTILIGFYLPSPKMQTALKRGVAYGILKKNGAHYSLPTDTRAECQEIATQELGLLDKYCRRSQRRKRRSRGCKPRKRREARHSRRGMCKCKKRGRSSRRRKSRCKPRRLRAKSRKMRCGCKKRDRGRARDRSMSPRSKIERLSLKPTLENDKSNDCENSSNSSMPSIERRGSSIPLS